MSIFIAPWLQPQDFMASARSGAELGANIASSAANIGGQIAGRVQQGQQFGAEMSLRDAAQRQAQYQFQKEMEAKEMERQQRERESAAAQLNSAEQRRLQELQFGADTDYRNRSLNADMDYRNRSLNANMDESAARLLLDSQMKSQEMELQAQRLNNPSKNYEWQQLDAMEQDAIASGDLQRAEDIRSRKRKLELFSADVSTQTDKTNNVKMVGGVPTVLGSTTVRKPLQATPSAGESLRVTTPDPADATTQYDTVSQAIKAGHKKGEVVMMWNPAKNKYQRFQME